MVIKKRNVCFVACCFLCLASCLAGNAMRSILNPKIYSDANGSHKLYVNPVEKDGGGSSECELKTGGMVAWKKHLLFSFWDAEVFPSGRTFGYAYSCFCSDGSKDVSGDGTLIVASLGKDGQLDFVDESSRRVSTYTHTPVYPVVKSMIFDCRNEKCLIRVEDEKPGNEKWWVYDLKSKEKSIICFDDVLSVGDSSFDDCSIATVYPLRNLPYLLVEWICEESGDSTQRVYELRDFSGKVLWAKSVIKKSNVTINESNAWSGGVDHDSAFSISEDGSSAVFCFFVGRESIKGGALV